MRKKLRVFTGVLLIVGSFGCFFYPDYHDFEIRQSVNRIEKNLQEKKENILKGNKFETEKRDVLYEEMQFYNQKLMTSGQQLTDVWSYEEIPNEINNLLDESKAVGYIEIPDMQVQLPLFVGASKDHLSKGAGILSQTSMPIGGKNTNCVIAAHRGWKGSPFFQYIENMKIGSQVYVNNFWETRIYQTVETKIIEPDDLDAILIQPEKDMLTLLSCHPYGVRRGHQRYLVYCEYVEKKDKKYMGEKAVEGNPQEPEISSKEKEKEDDPSKQFLIIEKISRTSIPLLTIIISLLIIFYNRK